MQKLGCKNCATPPKNHFKIYLDISLTRTYCCDRANKNTQNEHTYFNYTHWLMCEQGLADFLCFYYFVAAATTCCVDLMSRTTTRTFAILLTIYIFYTHRLHLLYYVCATFVSPFLWLGVSSQWLRETAKLMDVTYIVFRVELDVGNNVTQTRAMPNIATPRHIELCFSSL